MRLLFSFLLFNFYLATTAQIPSYVPTNGLVGWWPFNGNANDESGNGNNGVVNGATLTSDRFGNANSAFGFDGLNNFIEIANSTSLNPIDITINVWLNANDSNGCILEKTDPTNCQKFGYSITHEDEWNGWHGLSTYFGNGNCSNNGSPLIWGPRNAVRNNVWNMITVSINSQGEIYQYINGEMSYYNAVGQNFIPCNNSLSTLRFGKHWNNDPEWFNGKLDDIAIYNRTLTSHEITQLYTSTVSSPSTLEDTTSNVGIGTATPKRKLHVNDVMRLEPRDTSPANPAKGDIYFDGVINKIRYYNGTSWISL
jgi:hypothetical protein